METIPFDHFWEQPLLSLKLKPLHDESEAIFCPFAKVELLSICDTGLGLMPKSIVALPNGDLVLGTFSTRKAYTFKVFQSHPFQRIDHKKGYISLKEAAAAVAQSEQSAPSKTQA